MIMKVEGGDWDMPEFFSLPKSPAVKSVLPHDWRFVRFESRADMIRVESAHQTIAGPRFLKARTEVKAFNETLHFG